jgi:4-amino-4-deoxy-L-arabinose transferase-like glycosyltransferase
LTSQRTIWWLTAGIFALATVTFLAGLNLTPLFDRDEPRYAVASRQMVDTGNWVVPFFLDEPRLNKPIFIYWCQALAMKVFGPTQFAARLPSAIAMLLTMGLLAWILPKLFGVRRTLWTLFILPTSVLTLWAAKTCLTDSVLLLFIVGSMLCLYAIWMGRASIWTLVGMGAAIGLGLLTKGPVVLVYLAMPLVTLFVMDWWDRRKSLLPSPELKLVDPQQLLMRAFMALLLVIGVAVAVNVPWILMLETQRPGAIIEMFSSEVVKRGVQAQENHGGPPGYYLLLIWVTWFPWSLMLPAALVYGWKRRATPWVRFSLACVIGPWLFLELYKTKLPHYLLPSYVFLAMLTADAIVRCARGSVKAMGDVGFLRAALVWAILVGLTGLGLVGFTLFIKFDSWLFLLSSLLIAIVFGAMAFFTFQQFVDRRPDRAAMVMGGGMALICILFWTLYLPLGSAFNLTRRIAAELDKNNARDAWMIDYKEDSLAFYEGGTIRKQNDETVLQTTDPSTWPQWIVTTPEFFNAQPDNVKIRWKQVAELKGINVAQSPHFPTVWVMSKTR